MHDTLLIEKIYKAIDEICKKESVKKVCEIRLSVSLDSHITDDDLKSHLKDRDSGLFGEWTSIFVEKKYAEKLTAVIESIDGEIA